MIGPTKNLRNHGTGPPLLQQSRKSKDTLDLPRLITAHGFEIRKDCETTHGHITEKSGNSRGVKHVRKSRSKGLNWNSHCGTRCIINTRHKTNKFIPICGRLAIRYGAILYQADKNDTRRSGHLYYGPWI